MKKFALSFQHLIAMLGATVLIPVLCGIDIRVALFTSGVGTLIFHGITKGKVPVYLGSSAAFVAPIVLVADKYGMRYAFGGLVVAGLVYVAFGLLAKRIGPKKIANLFPPLVSGPIIAVIGLGLAPIAKDFASANWTVAVFTLIVTALALTKMKGAFNIFPILTGALAGYILSLFLGIVDFSAIAYAPWFSIPRFVLPKFSLDAILIIAPLSLVAMIEHIGDIKANGAVVGKDFVEDPGLHRTLIGDGIATSFAGFFGGPANTTYSENTGVLALTKIYDPSILRNTAIMAVVLSFCGKVGALINSIPQAVMGGISIVLFGMVASVGLRILIENKVDLTDSGNLLTVSLILIFGLSGAVLQLGSISLVGMSLAAIIGVISNKFIGKED